MMGVHSGDSGEVINNPFIPSFEREHWVDIQGTTLDFMLGRLAFEMCLEIPIPGV
ncbi:MAG: hypothetical protein ACFFCP_15620 [Promethearchaeota archaeon]